MENTEIIQEELKNRIVYCFKKTYTTTDDATRLESEYFLEQKMKNPIFWDILFSITQDDSNDLQLKKAIIIFLEKRISFQISTKVFDEKSIKFVLGYLYNCLSIKNLNLKVKLLTKESIMKISRSICKASFEVEQTWEFYFSQFINKYRDVKFAEGSSVEDIFGVIYFLSSFFEGVHDVSDGDLKFVYEFLIEVMQDMGKLVLGDEKCENLILWEIIHAYLRLLKQYLALISEDDLMQAHVHMIEEEKFQEIISKILTLYSDKSLIGNQSILILNKDNNFQTTINKLKIQCMDLVFQLMELLEEENGSKKILAVFQTSAKKGFLENLAQTIMNNLASIANLKDADLRYILDDETTNELVYNLLEFVEKLLELGSFYQFVSKTCKIFFFKGLLPFLTTRKSEVSLMEDEPTECVGRAEDLVNYQRSEIPKNKANSIIVLLCENVDGMLTYVTNLCLKMFEFSVNDQNSNEIEEMKNFEIFKNYTKIQFIDLSLILMSSLHLLVFKRDDLSGELKKFVMTNINKITKTSSKLVHMRLMMFLGIICEDYFCTLAGSHTLEFILQYFTQNLIDSNDKTLMLTSINCMMNILTPYILEIDEENNHSFNHDQLMLNLFKPLSIQITEALIEKCVGNFEKDDDVLEILEYILRLFSNLLVSENPAYISKILQKLSQTYSRIVKENPNSKNDSVPYKYLGLIKLITNQKKVIDELGNGIELSIEPILVSIQQPGFSKFTADVLDIMQMVTDSRKTVSNETFQFFLVFIGQGNLKSNKDSLDAAKFRFLNTILHYGKNLINQKISIVQDIIDQINQQNSQESITSKIFSLVNILENCHQSLNEEYFKKIMDNSYVEDNTINFDVYRVRKTWIALAGFFLCPNKTLKILEECGKLDEIVSNLILFNDEFKTPYSTKLYVLGLVSLMNQDVIHQCIQPKSIRIIESLIDRLLDAAKNKNTEAPDRKDSDDSEDFNIFAADFKNLNAGLSNIDEYAIYDKMISQLKSVDEFLCFRNFILRLKDLKPVGFQKFVNSLRGNYKKKLVKLVDFKRIVVDDETGKTEARRVVKIKRRKR